MSGRRPHFVLLPGLEGAGHYDGAVLAALARLGRAELLPLPAPPAPGYGPLADALAPRLPDRPFVLVAESFSGPLAILLARQAPPGLAALVLASTFACLLHPLRPFARWLVGAMDPRLLPVAPTSRIMWRGFDSAAHRHALRADLASVPPGILRARAAAALRVDLRDGPRLGLPTLVLAGRDDLVVPPKAVRTLLEVVPAAEFVELDAPHMLLQTRTAEAAALIGDFVARRVPAA